jgi:hypothetical protein
MKEVEIIEAQLEESIIVNTIAIIDNFFFIINIFLNSLQF